MPLYLCYEENTFSVHVWIGTVELPRALIRKSGIGPANDVMTVEEVCSTAIRLNASFIVWYQAGKLMTTQSTNDDIPKSVKLTYAEYITEARVAPSTRTPPAAPTKVPDDSARQRAQRIEARARQAATHRSEQAKLHRVPGAGGEALEPAGLHGWKTYGELIRLFAQHATPIGDAEFRCMQAGRKIDLGILVVDRIYSQTNGPGGGKRLYVGNEKGYISRVHTSLELDDPTKDPTSFHCMIITSDQLGLGSAFRTGYDGTITADDGALILDAVCSDARLRTKKGYFSPSRATMTTASCANAFNNVLITLARSGLAPLTQRDRFEGNIDTGITLEILTEMLRAPILLAALVPPPPPSPR